MPNMKSLSPRVQQLWSRSKFLAMEVKGHSQGHLIKIFAATERGKI